MCVSVVVALDVAELKQEVSEETVESWCVEEQALEVDMNMLQQVEELERKVISAGLQVKVPANSCRIPSFFPPTCRVLNLSDVIKYCVAMT